MAMAEVKRTIKNFDIFVASFAQDAVTKHFRNGFAVHLYYTNGKHMSNSARILDECLQQSDSNYVPNLNVIKGNLYRLMEKVSVLKRSIDKSWHLIEDLLLKPLHVPVSSSKKRRKVSEATVIVQNVDKNLLKINSSNTFELSTVGAQEECLLPQLDQQQQGTLPLIVEKKLKTDCEKCSKIRKSYIMAVSELKFKLRSSRKSLREMSKLYNIRCVNQNMKRKDAARDKLRMERKALKKENFKLKNEIKMLKSINGKENVNFSRNYETIKGEKNITRCNDISQTNLKTLTKKAQSKEERIQELEVEINKLMCELKLLQEEHHSVTKIVTMLVDPELESKSERSKIQKSQKYDSRSVDISFCCEEMGDISMGGWCEVDKVTDIPANVTIEIEEQTYITVLENGALEPFNHKDFGEGPTNPADIFTTNMIDNSKVAFKSVNGKYWSLKTDGKVASIAETLGTREQFEPVFQDGKLALIGFNKCFLSYNEAGDIVCESCTADPKHWFKLRSIAARMKDPVEEGVLNEG